MNRGIYIIFHLILVGGGIKAAYMLFDDHSRLGGLILCLCLVLIGVPLLQENLYEYQKAKEENDIEKVSSRLFRISRAGGLLLAAFLCIIYLFLNWYQLN